MYERYDAEIEKNKIELAKNTFERIGEVIESMKRNPKLNRPVWERLAADFLPEDRQRFRKELDRLDGTAFGKTPRA
jgi:hypothetical protein